jgi:hypothetical protein
MHALALKLREGTHPDALHKVLPQSTTDYSICALAATCNRYSVCPKKHGVLTILLCALDCISIETVW